MAINWRTAYDNRAAVSDAPARLAHLAEAGARTLADPAWRVSRLAHGPGPRDRVLLLAPRRTARGLAVFVHGGYWMRGAPEDFAALAGGALARGWAVALPAYPLCPTVRIRQIGRAVVRGVGAAAACVPGPVRLAGHSAGGHLAARLVCPGGLRPGLRARVTGVLSISGLHDLRPLMRTPMQPVLRLTTDEAVAESPALAVPAEGIPVTLRVGGAELPELRRQTALLATVWGGLGVDVSRDEVAGADHFSVLDGLPDPEAGITRAWLD